MENYYPNIRIRIKKRQVAVRVYLFVAILIEVLLIYLNWKFYSGMKWSVITGMGFAYTYFVAQFAAINDNVGYRFKLLSFTFFGLLYVILIDYVIGYNGWSVNYVLPSALLFIDLAIVILMIVNRRNWQSYMMLEIFTSVLSGILLLMMVLGVVAQTFLGGFTFAASILLFLGTLIIGDRRARIELKRRFHVR